MLILAEIADKMWSIAGLFFFALLLALPLSLPGLIRWWLALPSVALAAYGNLALWTMLREPGIRGAVLPEMGWPWVIGCFLAWNGTFAFCWLGLRWVHRRRVRAARIREGECANCGYSHRGNVSGTCPECGQRLSDQWW
jgi:hypothetical protein